MNTEEQMKGIRVEMEEIKQRMSDAKHVDPEDERKFAILTGELNDLKKMQTDEDAPMFLKESSERFVQFLDKLKTSENGDLIESVKRGYMLLESEGK